MRPINLIVIHCSATGAGVNFRAADIDRWHRAKGWNGIGYHYVVGLDGKVEPGRSEDRIGSHVQGHNAESIGIVYVGGLDKDGKAADTRTSAQKKALHDLVADLQRRFPKARTVGHRDLSPDLDKDGVVEKHEWMKECPSFDVVSWLKAVGLRSQ